MTGGDQTDVMRPKEPRSQRKALGRAHREKVPFEQLARVPALDARPDAVGILDAQNDIRVQTLVPLRYSRMSADAFSFLRGAAAVMASDLGSQPSSGIDVQLCGDAHLNNFGLFATAERTTVFDINDFDETHPGPFEWDVKRLAASFVVATQHAGLPRKVGRQAAAEAALWYAGAMKKLAGMPTLDVWNVKLDMTSLLNALPKGSLRTATRAADAKSLRSTSEMAVQQLTEVVDGVRRFRNAPPVLVRLQIDQAEEVIEGFERGYAEYVATLQTDRRVLLSRFGFVDLGHRVVGVGSVGMRALVLLLQSGDGDPLVLQMKQATTSVLEPYTAPSAYTNHGERVVAGQRLTIASPDPFLGWTTGTGNAAGDYYVRQMRDGKASVDVTKLDAKGFVGYARLCGAVLARAHARAGDASMISGYLGNGKAFADAVSAFGLAYAGINAADYERFIEKTGPMLTGESVVPVTSTPPEQARAAKPSASKSLKKAAKKARTKARS